MIISLRNKATLSEISGVIRCLERLGLKSQISKAGERTLIGVLGEGAEGARALVSGLPGVVEVALGTKPYPLASREFRPEDTRIRINGTSIGGGTFVVIAGPCSVESREQILEVAEVVKKEGGHLLRGGVFKPRSSPYSFQGLGLKGLEYLALAKERTGLPVVTEVLSSKDVSAVAEHADVLQIGARNMQNFTLLNAVGAAGKPVLLKRGMMATVEELLLAAEYILKGGNARVILCERGIRTFETATRNTLDITAVPLIRQLSHLPIFVDPSHATGRRDLVPPLARVALAAGADGLMVEVHPHPEKAKSDGGQSLTPGMFSRMMADLRATSRALGMDLRNDSPLPHQEGGARYRAGRL